jgi:hypothetical protein
MNIKSNMPRWFLPAVALPFTLLGLGACGAEPEGDLESTTGALGVSAFPDGLTCGLSYLNGPPVVDGTCEGVHTLANPLPFHFGWAKQYDGDSGLPSGNGFYHQRRTLLNSPQPDTSNVILPQGTACGFKHTARGDTEKCFGLDPELGNCPFGWTRRIGGDSTAPGGSNFVWCEYNDSNHTCDFGSCLGSMPSGLACGISDNDRSPRGSCQRLTSGIAPNQCPAGYRWSFITTTNAGSGYYDAGRSGGHGIGWCAKN